MLPIGLLLSGWAAQERVHWIVTDIVSSSWTSHASVISVARWYGSMIVSLTHSFHWQGISFIGAGMILIFQSIQTYVVDAFTLHAASGMDNCILIPDPSILTSFACL